MQAHRLCNHASTARWPQNPHPMMIFTFALTPSHQVILILLGMWAEAQQGFLIKASPHA
jgi:hypothetical protein